MFWRVSTGSVGRDRSPTGALPANSRPDRISTPRSSGLTTASDTRDGVIRETFFYVFGEPARIARLRVDVRPVDESPANTARLLPALQRALTARFGAPTHEPELMEIGFRHLRYGEPVAGDHWQGGGLHYFLHANLSGGYPMGMRRGVQLVVITDRLFAEREMDSLILRAEGIFGEAQEDDNPVRARLKARIGAPYIRAMRATLGKAADRPRLVNETIQDLTAILRESDRADAPRRALCLLAADQVVNKLSQWLIESSPNGERESGEAAGVRRLLSRYGVKLGGMTHYGGLEYRHELLWRVSGANGRRPRPVNWPSWNCRAAAGTWARAKAVRRTPICSAT